jgi:transcriptional regulator with GAF, ATPase, and Fis domain/tetratricopeptide (TPR) repeat protein
VLLSPAQLLHHRYEVIRPLGEGGLGRAYLVRDRVRHASVALKVVRTGSTELIEALKDEFSRLRGIVHPHLTEVRDFGSLGDEERHVFYTSSFIDGTTLDRHAASARWSAVVSPLCDALEGLRALHQLGIVHGDFKPSNILVDGARARGVLIDLSCSQLAGQPCTSTAGTPGYIAPERREGAELDARSDLYAVGVTLGRFAERLGDEVPRAVARLIERLTHSSPRARPSDVAEVLEALGRGDASDLPRFAQPTRLLGREAELALFDEMLARLLDGRDGERALLITADDGMGATRLLEEMKWRAQLRCSVVEADAAGPEAFMGMLRAVAGKGTLASGMGALVEARERVRAEPRRPRVALLDDAHLLEGGERELWRAYLRSVEPDDPLVLVATTHRGQEGVSTAVRCCTLEPLGPSEVTRWVQAVDASADPEAAMRLSGGCPAVLRELGQWLGHGRPLDGFVAGREATARRLAALTSLRTAERQALALLAAKGGPVDAALLGTGGASRLDVAALVAAGWVVVDGGAVRLARLAEADPLLEALGPELRRQALLQVADLWRQRRAAVAGTSAESTCAARAALSLARAGSLAPAEAQFDGARELWEAHPDPWTEVARSLGQATTDVPRKLATALVLEHAGKPDEALSLLARVLRARPAAALARAARLQAGGCYLRAGRARAAVLRLGRATLGLEPEAPERARAADLLSRALIKTGQYEEAARVAREALAGGAEEPVRADLHDDLGVALGYLGRLDDARRHLRDAHALHERLGRLRALGRSASYRALVDYRAGDTHAAARGFRHALELAERCGGVDMIMYAAQNLGVVSHQHGHLGQALDAYLRTLRMAIVMAETAAEVTVRGNLAKLYVDIGLFERAEHHARRAEEDAQRIGARLPAASALAVRAEARLLSGDLAQAVELAADARQALAEEGAVREVIEARLLVCEGLLAGGRREEALAEHDRAARAAAGLGAADVSARIGFVRGKLALAEGDALGAVEELEEAARLVRASGQSSLRAEIAQELSGAYRDRGALVPAATQAAIAAELWEKMAATLPSAYKDAFWGHPRHEREAPTGVRHEERGTARERKLERLVEINRRLSAALDVDELCGYTIDSALALTGAERGFVLLRGEEGALAIAQARNLETRDGSAELSFSTSVAERVVSTGEPFCTADAQRDARLVRRHSVHALRLESVVCVPIRAGDAILGALYLDHRTRRGAFADDAVSLLGAFSDQVAIALENARLVRELGERSRELDRERRRIAELAKGQAERIDELSERVRAQQRELEHRYDYAGIVGRSRAMQQIFTTLDRVIDVSIPVLIEGESGTGKELIARAIHYQSARRERPLVTLNCGALPDQLLEAELFGAKKGAFTGATEARDGLFVSARGGTVYLDELAEMPPAMQVKLLRVLTEREVRPLGSSKPVPVEFRLVCATNRRLRDEVAAGRFREDLYYRVGVVELCVPPLRERREDIPELCERTLERAAETARRTVPRVSKLAMRALLEYGWPGNVRELENTLTRAVLLAEGDELTVEHLALPSAHPTAGLIDRSRYREDEAAAMAAALRKARWSVSQAARALGIPRATFYRKMQRYGLSERR